MTDSSPTDQSARCMTDETGFDSSILSVESLQSLAMPTVCPQDHQFSNNNKTSPSLPPETVFPDVPNAPDSPAHRCKKSVKVSSVPHVGFFPQSPSVTGTKRTKRNDVHGHFDNSVAGQAQVMFKTPKKRVVLQEVDEQYDTTIDIGASLTLRRLCASNASFLRRILDSLPPWMRSATHSRNSSLRVGSPAAPGICSQTDSNTGLRPGTSVASSHQKPNQATATRRSGLTALELLLFPKKKTSQVPMRRQLSRRVPRKDSQRNPWLSQNVSIISAHPELSIQSSVDTQTFLPCHETQAVDRRESEENYGASAVRLPSVTPSSRPIERNPLRRVSRLLTAAGPALVRKVSRLGSSHATDPELESLEASPLRYRPVALDQLSRTTRFSKQELQFMYRGFKQECPSGVISEETFKRIYGKLFPVGNTTDDGSGRNTAMYAHYVFGTMDPEGTGQITFGDFITGLSVLLKGSLAERVAWIFNLYDINNDGRITRDELIDVVSSIYDLMSDQTVPRIDDSTAINHVDKIFDKLDLNKDGVVTMDEFMEYCSKNKEVVHSMNIFGTL
ncbi:uncharacterized protein LOC108676865 [Hyalella azteca]|uniref:Uncharacterized protein LOC108676865 n=1 Tax=Hyalella azteca TaxID=294128 RepID=A0A979FGD5_HYAAZ|nr:uncharacterized protein LOC108676865 [Hyalella azteca]